MLGRNARDKGEEFIEPVKENDAEDRGLSTAVTVFCYVGDGRVSVGPEEP